MEVAKLVASAATPVVVVVIGFWISRRLKKLESLQWARQKVVERRLKIYDDLVPHLNDVLCYFTYIGNWKDQEPPTIVQLKRKMDRIAYINAPLLPPEFLDKYNAFIGLCFETYTKWGGDARLRSMRKRRQEALGEKWKPEWDTCFADEATEPAKIAEEYRKLVAYLANELGVGVRVDPMKTGKVPANIC